MISIPDAPWIRDAENNGVGSSDPEPKCPICYQECERLYRYNGGRDILGCENCIDTVDSYDWLFEFEEEG